MKKNMKRKIIWVMTAIFAAGLMFMTCSVDEVKKLSLITPGKFRKLIRKNPRLMIKLLIKAFKRLPGVLRR